MPLNPALKRYGLYLALLAGGAAACASDEQPQSSADEHPEWLGGDTTVFDTSGNAFTFAARNLDDEGRNAFALGAHFFNRNWVAAPASASGNDGLGPTFNATSCSACHAKEGRGTPPKSENDPFVGLLVRLSVPGDSLHGAPMPEPNYGGQFNPFAVLGVPAEGQAHVRYEERGGSFADGAAYTLRVPSYSFSALSFGAMSSSVMTSPRLAQSIIGLGLLQAVPESDVRAREDANDVDGDGVSGRANSVWDTVGQRAALGRFGWKANQPSIHQQVADAFLGDIGITSSLNASQNCTPVQTACVASPVGGQDGAPELSEQKLDAVTRWNMTLAVPARRNWKNATVQRGETLFAAAACDSCHVPKMQTGVLEGFAALSNQTIRPFTDLLLHDMGAELADGRPDYLASGAEWRTPPLWGLGLLKTVSGGVFLMHDGRARGIAEAILWHGGEGARSRDAFVAMSAQDREALLAFLNDL